MTKRYRLTRDLKDVKSGSIFETTSLGWLTWKKEHDGVQTIINYPISVLEETDGLFEELPDTPEEIKAPKPFNGGRCGDSWDNWAEQMTEAVNRHEQLLKGKND